MTSPQAQVTAALADRYRVERELGAGGMATVYLAQDVKHERKVAIKVLRPALAAAIGAERFLKEIKTTANLQHPHILGLLDSGDADGLLWYAMPFVAGESLRDRLLREKQLPVADALRIATEVADALQHAHQHGIVHRDIKPENILLQGGHALVADFGIALAAAATGASRMTDTGMSLGTPQYMSPEQAMGERDLDARTDIYALGCVTYEMLAGEPPFTGPTAQAIVAKVMTEDPKPLLLLRRSVPRNVDAAVRTALQKVPADRFPTAAAFATALTDEHFAGTAVVGAAALAAFWRPLCVAALGATAVVTGLLVRAERRQLPAAVASPWRVALAFGDSAGPLGVVNLSPDGKSIVYRARSAQGVQLWVRDAGGLDPVAIPGTNDRPTGATFSPDGQRIAFFAGDSIRVAARSGNAPPVVVGGGFSRAGLAWSDDDHLIAPTDSGLVRLSVSGGRAERVTTVDTAHGERIHGDPEALPGGRGVLFRVWHQSVDLATVRIAVSDPATGQHTELMPGVVARYAGPGYLLVLQADGMLVAVPFDVSRRRLTGPPVPLLAMPQGASWFASDRNGRLIYPSGVPAEVNRLVRVARDGTAAVIDPPVPIAQVAVSPDGARLAYVVATGMTSAINVRDLRTGSTATIAIPGTRERDPLFTPDGNAILFIGLSLQGSGLFRATPGSAAAPERLPGDIGDVPALSGDGRTIFSGRVNAKEHWEIAAHSLEHPEAPDRLVVATSGDATASAPSPDGRWLAYLSNESGKSELYVRPLDPSRTDQWKVSRSGATEAQWSRDGRELYYTTDFTGSTGADSMMAAEVAPGPGFVITGQRALFSTRAFLTGKSESWIALPKRGEFLMWQIGLASNRTPPLIMLEQWQSLLPSAVKASGTGAGR